MKFRTFLIIIAIVFTSLQFSPQVSAETFPFPITPTPEPPVEKGIEHAIAVQAQHEKGLLSRPGVRGVGIGEKSGKTGLVILVDDESRIPSLPTDVDNLPTIIQVVGEINAHADLGTSGGSAITCSNWPLAGGTIGFKVCDNTNVYNGGLITNNHVAAAGCPYLCPNNAPIGTDFAAPGREDCCGWYYISIGDLERFVPLVLDGHTVNYVDAAFVYSTDYNVTNTISGIGTQNNIVREAYIGQQVCKSGRTSGKTCGQVTGINLTMTIPYNGGTCGAAVFHNVIQYEPTSPYIYMSLPGDSGSPVVDSVTREAVALNFAGTVTGNYGWGNPIGDVLSALNVSLCSSITARTAPQPSVKINGSSGPLTVHRTQPLTLTISLNPGGYTNQNADWWIVRYNQGLNTWYSLDPSLTWIEQVGMIYNPFYRGGLFSLSPTNWNMGTLPIGTYYFYFGVDLKEDGIYDSPAYVPAPVIVTVVN